MMNCKQYVFQLTSGKLGEADLPQRRAAGMHRMMCVHCRRFTHNNAVLDDILAARKQAAVTPLGAYRTLDVESENAPQRGPFLPDSPPHGGAMGQEDNQK